MLSEDEGLALAASYLAEEAGDESDSVRIDPPGAYVVDGLLIVHWNSKEFLDDGDEWAQLGGNPPIAVDLTTGQCRYLDFLESFEYERRLGER
jgi:hypothetical protein